MGGIDLCCDDISIILMTINKEQAVCQNLTVAVKDGQVVHTSRQGIDGKSDSGCTS